MTFEAKVKELETLVADLQKGELSLSDSIEYYKKGLALTKELHEALKDVEQKVSVLTDEGSVESL